MSPAQTLSQRGNLNLPIIVLLLQIGGVRSFYYQPSLFDSERNLLPLTESQTQSMKKSYIY